MLTGSNPALPTGTATHDLVQLTYHPRHSIISRNKHVVPEQQCSMPGVELLDRAVAGRDR